MIGEETINQKNGIKSIKGRLTIYFKMLLSLFKRPGGMPSFHMQLIP
tara:strand:+ start:674 stop:814 length:141 start_codon:yes stop_codon:yes gene_type:complete